MKNTMIFTNKVLQIVREIPKGKTMTYSEVAALAGSPGAARAVGNIMSNNFDHTVPCHRVIHTDGSLGSYNRGGKTKKLQLLQSEGAL